MHEKLWIPPDEWENGEPPEWADSYDYEITIVPDGFTIESCFDITKWELTPKQAHMLVDFIQQHIPRPE